MALGVESLDLRTLSPIQSIASPGLIRDFSKQCLEITFSVSSISSIVQAPIHQSTYFDSRKQSAFKMVSRSPSPSSSPLSNIDSDSYEADYYQQHMSESAMPLSKRQRLDEGSLRATPTSHGPDLDTLSSISSDTSGDVPQSPGAARVDDEDAHHEQVTVCAWEGCHGGDFGNMDRLVAHIHNDHIEGRGKKYTCEWDQCSRKSYPHASAYALKAHMRSHTREKPFYCALPGR